MIYGGDLYIIAVRGEVYRRHYATLAAIHRALITNVDDPIPDIEFTFNVDDRVDSDIPQWLYARPTSSKSAWLMPDFGYWSWPETKVGSYGEVQIKALAMEDGTTTSSSTSAQKVVADRGPYTWTAKTDKLLWRGATMGLEVREKLVSVTEGQDWADVKVLDWHNDESMTHDLKSMAEHCQYKYLAHTEGNSYSGRLKYLQNCRSVLIMHKLEWIQHYQGVMKSSGLEQNFVEVSRDFSDLEKTVKELRADQKKAERIAQNSVEAFRERYLTPAAEACYWRHMFWAWWDVQTFQPELWGNKEGDVDMQGNGEFGEKVWRGVPWESYILMRETEWKPQ